MQGIVISLVAAIACKFMQDRYAGRYLGSKRVTILVSTKRPRTSQKYLRYNVTYIIIWLACAKILP
jgi:hypothetical protein